MRKEALEELDISQDQLIMLGMLMGTDFNDGVHGIGPKKGLEKVKEHKSLESLLGDEDVEFESDNSPEAIFDFFKNPPVEDQSFEFKDPNEEKIREILVDRHEFSNDRIESKMKGLMDATSSRQSGLGSFT